MKAQQRHPDTPPTGLRKIFFCYPKEAVLVSQVLMLACISICAVYDNPTMVSCTLAAFTLHVGASLEVERRYQRNVKRKEKKETAASLFAERLEDWNVVKGAWCVVMFLLSVYYLEAEDIDIRTLASQ